MIFPLCVLLLLLPRSYVWSMEFICESRQNRFCRSTVSYPNSIIYGLQQNYSSNSYYGHVILTVFGKFCPKLDTIGPSWYRLEPIHQIKGLGFFETPQSQWSATIENDGIEFFNSEEPLAILDLPRQFIWRFKQQSKPETHCFKLTIQQNNTCQQIISPNCQDINITTQAATTIPSTTTPPTTTSTTSTPSPTLRSPKECRSCDNVTIRESSLTCGSDGRIYPHVCHLRRRRCLYDSTLQRDREWKSCNQSGTPTPPTAPKPTSPSDNPRHTCLWEKKVYYELGQNTKCDCQGLYKPIQCRKVNDSIKCYCSTRHGNQIGRYGSWTFDCNEYFTSNPKLRCTR